MSEPGSRDSTANSTLKDASFQKLYHVIRVNYVYKREMASWFCNV